MDIIFWTLSHYRVTHFLADLGLVDLDLGSSTVLLGQHGSCRKPNGLWNNPNRSQPNPGPRGDGSPCTVSSLFGGDHEGVIGAPSPVNWPPLDRSSEVFESPTVPFGEAFQVGVDQILFVVNSQEFVHFFRQSGGRFSEVARQNGIIAHSGKAKRWRLGCVIPRHGSLWPRERAQAT